MQHYDEFKEAKIRMSQISNTEDEEEEGSTLIGAGK